MFSTGTVLSNCFKLTNVTPCVKIVLHLSFRTIILPYSAGNVLMNSYQPRVDKETRFIHSSSPPATHSPSRSTNIDLRCESARDYALSGYRNTSRSKLCTCSKRLNSKIAITPMPDMSEKPGLNGISIQSCDPGRGRS